MQKSLSQEIKDRVIWEYSNTDKTRQQIAFDNKIALSSITNILVRNKIPKRGKILIPVNENYFEVINTPEKAIILGMIAADGNISNISTLRSSDNYNEMKLTLGLEANDSYYLQNILNKMESKHEVYIYEKSYVKLDGNVKKIAVFNICRTKLCQDLIKLGIGKDKSTNLKFPNIANNLKRFFLLGYFDGNGSWIINYQHSKPSISFSISSPVKSFIIECVDFVANELNLNTEIKINDEHNNEKCWAFRYGGNDQCFEIFKWIYKDAPLFLNRKFEKAKQHFESIQLLG